MSFIEDLAFYLRAGYPALWVETYEEDRCCGDILKAAQEADMGMRRWRMTKGWTELREGGEVRVDDEITAVGALNSIANMTEETVYVFINFHYFLDSPEVVQTIKDVIPIAKNTGRCMVFVSAAVELPRELEKEVTVIRYELPSREDLRSTLEAVAEDSRENLRNTLGAAAGDSVLELSEEIANALVEAALGLTMQEAENAFALAVVKHGAFNQQAVETVQKEKINAIQKSKLLEFYPAEKDGLDAVGGLENLKEWLYIRKKAFSKKARELNIEVPKGILLLGCPGTGKTLTAKAIAKTWGWPLLRFDVGRVFGSLVGQSLHGDQEVYFCRTSGGKDVVRMTIREAYEAGYRGYTFSYTDHGGFRIARVIDIIRHERKEKFLKILTKRGYEVIVTEGHSLFTRKPSRNVPVRFDDHRGKPDQEGGMLVPAKASELKVGDKIAISRYMAIKQSKATRIVSHKNFSMEMFPKVAELMGLWVADGSSNRSCLRFSCSTDEPEVIEFIKSFGHCTEYCKNDKAVDLTLADYGLYALFCCLGVAGKDQSARTKRVPAWMFGMDNEIVAAFLRGYFSGDGSFSGRHLEASTRSEKLALDVAGLLRRFGIVPYLKKQYKNGHPMWRLVVSKALELKYFADYIGFMVNRKNNALHSFINSVTVNNYLRGKKRYSVMWDEVISIEEFNDDDPYSYDISVEGTEKFVSNWVIVHNSEANMRRALELAEAVAPVVLVIDEMEKGLAGVNSSGATDSGVTARVLGELLTWMNDKTSPVFIVGTVNKVENLPPELLRKGRWDDVFFVDLPNEEERRQIFAIHLKKRNIALSPDNRDWISRSEGFSGAEIETAIKEAQLIALAEDREVNEKDILKALKQLVPLSTTMKEEIERLREWARLRARYASKVHIPDMPEQRRSRQIRVK